MKFYYLFFLIAPIFVKSQKIGIFKEATAFIYAKDSVGNPTPNGTCFIIGVKSLKDTSLTYPFFVTAKHVLQNRDGSLMKDFFIRMNTKDSNSRLIYFPIDTSRLSRNVFFHPDENVDIAVFLYAPGKDDYNFKIIPEALIKNRDEFRQLKIEEGTNAFFTGLFVPYIGEHKIFPIFRFGNVSLITDEKINWIGKQREMILLEISSFGGNSGAPVYLEIPQPNGQINVILGGILSGTFRDAANIQIIQTNATPIALYNNGISGVTPAYLLKEILETKVFKRMLGE